MSLPRCVTPCSACNVLSASLLACLHDFIHVPRRANLENVAIRQRRMLADELYGMIHVPRLKNNNSAELLFGFGIGAVDRRDLAVLPREGQGGLRPLKRFATTPVPVGAKMVVIFKACVEHGVSLALLHAIELAFVVVAKTDVFHCSSPLSGLNEPATERYAGSIISSPVCMFRGRSGQVIYFLSLGSCSGAGKKRSSRTSPATSQAMAPFFAHANASFMSAHSSIQKPPMCSLVSVYGPSVTSTLPSGWARSVLALPAGEMPQANFLTPAAIISRLSSWISSIIASVTIDGSKLSGM